MRTWSNVAIVGPGLIGGSIGLAIKRRKLAKHVTGIGRRRSSLQKALKNGAVDSTTTQLAKGVRDAELIVVCTPVGQVVEHVKAAAAHARDTAIITDAASTKRRIAEDLASYLPEGTRFVGSHPLAGSEKTGPEHADAQLFEGRVAVITPTTKTPPRTIADVKGLWRALGARPCVMPPAEHDALLALTSHLPHIVASALISSIDEAQLPYSAGGLYDTTRIAGGNDELWAQILMDNANDVVAAIERYESVLGAARKAIESRDFAGLKEFLNAATARRTALEKSQRRKA